jgi:hypothetical protein
LKNLHAHDGMVAVAFEDLARTVEVRVGIIPLAHLFDRQIEDLRPQSGPGHAVL